MARPEIKITVGFVSGLKKRIQETITTITKNDDLSIQDAQAIKQLADVLIILESNCFRCTH